MKDELILDEEIMGYIKEAENNIKSRATETPKHSVINPDTVRTETQIHFNREGNSMDYRKPISPSPIVETKRDLTDEKVKEPSDNDNLTTKGINYTAALTPTNSLALHGASLVGSEYDYVDRKVSDEDSLALPELRDNHGTISEGIMEVERDLNTPVLPFALTRIAPCVVDLKYHDIVEFDGVKYSSNKLSSDRLQMVDECIEQMKSIFEEKGTAFVFNLMIKVNIKGCEFLTCRFSSFEIDRILSRLARYRATLLRNRNNGYLQIKIGDFYE